jgi:hypothetical protein
MIVVSRRSFSASPVIQCIPADRATAPKRQGIEESTVQRDRPSSSGLWLGLADRQDFLLPIDAARGQSFNLGIPQAAIQREQSEHHTKRPCAPPAATLPGTHGRLLWPSGNYCASYMFCWLRTNAVLCSQLGGRCVQRRSRYASKRKLSDRGADSY